MTNYQLVPAKRLVIRGYFDLTLKSFEECLEILVGPEGALKKLGFQGEIKSEGETFVFQDQDDNC